MFKQLTCSCLVSFIAASNIGFLLRPARYQQKNMDLSFIVNLREEVRTRIIYIYIYYDYIYIYIIADIIPIPNAKCGAFLGAIWMGTSPAGPATDSGLHDDLRWQNEQQHDYGPAWKPTGRDLPQETKQLHLFNGKSGDQKIVCFRDFQWFPY